MGFAKYQIGELVELTTEINFDLRYRAEDVRGMTISKEIIPTKADVTNTDLSKFLVVSPEVFVFNPRTHGKKIGFGYNDTKETFLISWNNVAFRVKREMKDVIMAKYLFLHFNREEWDREACYRSWGSSTEVFSWEALCEMEIYVPSINIQKKYVNIYNAIVANQQNYERGLEDLKLTFETLIDRYKYVAHKKYIGELLEEIDCRNEDNSIDNVQGINIMKQFMPSVADTTDVNLQRYKIVRNGQFAYSGMQTGRDECIRIALYSGDCPIIISPAYSVLQVKTKDVLPEYIMMWFFRDESDRRGWFMSDASIRANLDLDRFFETEIPIPERKIQDSIVKIYNAYKMRHEINEKLKAQIIELCPILIKGSLQ